MQGIKLHLSHTVDNFFFILLCIIWNSITLHNFSQSLFLPCFALIFALSVVYDCCEALGDLLTMTSRIKDEKLIKVYDTFTLGGFRWKGIIKSQLFNRHHFQSTPKRKYFFLHSFLLSVTASMLCVQHLMSKKVIFPTFPTTSFSINKILCIFDPNTYLWLNACLDLLCRPMIYVQRHLYVRTISHNSHTHLFAYSFLSLSLYVCMYGGWYSIDELVDDLEKCFFHLLNFRYKNEITCLENYHSTSAFRRKKFNQFNFINCVCYSLPAPSDFILCE